MRGVMDKLSEKLNKLFNDENFMENILSFCMAKKAFSVTRIKEILSNYLIYYLYTNDTNLELSYSIITKEVSKLMNSKFSSELYDKVITNGYLTHSFNGYDRKWYEAYGFDYVSLLNKVEREDLNCLRWTVNMLERNLKQSGFVDDFLLRDQIFLCAPGMKTFHYLLEASPERLFLGPLYQPKLQEQPIIVGEAKQEYYKRVLMRNIEKNFTGDALCDAVFESCQIVTSAYCTKNPCFALIPIASILDKTLGRSYDLSDSFADYLNENIKLGKTRVEDFLTIEGTDAFEPFGDLATYCSCMPNTDDFAIVEGPDLYNLKQKYAQMMGYKPGKAISFNYCYPTDEKLIYKLKRK